MKIIITLVILMVNSAVLAQEGLITVKSDFSVSETADRFEKQIKEKGLRFFARIDHADNAKGVGLKLDPTQLILFGNPKVGTLLMQCQATVAIDLPQKALVWESDDQVWIGYNNPQYLQDRHKLEGCDEIIHKVSNLLASLAQSAAQPED